VTKPTRATPESGSTPLSSRVDPILTPAKAEREAAANRSVDTSDTLKQTVTKATPSVSDETLALFGRRNDFATRYHLTRRGKIKRLGQITRIVEQFDVLHGLTPVKMRLMFEALGPTFVKVGQILSMRSEILPQSFCDELAKLRADADPMPYSTVLSTTCRWPWGCMKPPMNPGAPPTRCSRISTPSRWALLHWRKCIAPR